MLSKSDHVLRERLAGVTLKETTSHACNKHIKINLHDAFSLTALFFYLFILDTELMYV